MADFAGIYSRRPSVPRLKRDEKYKDKDQRISVCTDCSYGIFTNHIREWTSRGLVHTDCNNPRGLDASKTVT